MKILKLQIRISQTNTSNEEDSGLRMGFNAETWSRKKNKKSQRAIRREGGIQNLLLKSSL